MLWHAEQPLSGEGLHERFYRLDALGSVRLSELARVLGGLGLALERDLYFTADRARYKVSLSPILTPRLTPSAHRS
ncbi:MAG: hypothetical protein NVS9B15_22260 [Acidobacteriaceae bacterium]